MLSSSSGKCLEVASARSCGRSVCNVLGKPRSIFRSSCTSRHSYHHCIVRVPCSFHPWRHLLFVVCLAEPTLNNLTGVRWVSHCFFSWRFILMNSICDQPISKRGRTLRYPGYWDHKISFLEGGPVQPIVVAMSLYPWPFTGRVKKSKLV